eukprot:3900415-Amphidinium_carterae.1
MQEASHHPAETVAMLRTRGLNALLVDEAGLLQVLPALSSSKLEEDIASQPLIPIFEVILKLRLSAMQGALIPQPISWSRED